MSFDFEKLDKVDSKLESTGRSGSSADKPKERNVAGKEGLLLPETEKVPGEERDELE